MTRDPVENNLRLPGQYFDEETGLHYNWNRYYYSETGRYLQKDSIGYDGGINPFVYVKANPLYYIDYEGLAFVTPGEGQAIVDIARSFIGTPYYDGGGPRSSKARADCSGAVWLIYNEAGYPTNYSSSRAFPSNPNFRKVPDNIPQQGDVGQWNGHVLIYDKNANTIGAGKRENALSARNNKYPFGPVNVSWWTKNKGPVTWYRYYKDDNKKYTNNTCQKCDLSNAALWY